MFVYIYINLYIIYIVFHILKARAWGDVKKKKTTKNDIRTANLHATPNRKLEKQKNTSAAKKNV